MLQIIFPLAAYFLVPQQQLPLIGVGYAAAAPSTPTLAQFIGKSGNDAGRATSPAELQLWNYDSVGPRTLQSGSMLWIAGEWPNTVSGCTAPCAPGFKDSAGNTLSTVFTVGTGTGHCYDGTYNHQFSYEQNLPSGITYVQDQWAHKVNNDNFGSGVV